MTPHRPEHSNRQDSRTHKARAETVRSGRWRIEVLLFVGMLAVYQLSRTLVVGDASEAIQNSFSVINLEKALGVFYEPTVQQAVIDNLHLTKALNLFYIWAHLPVTAAFFVWLYRRRRHAYTLVRNAFFVANLLALVVFVLFPVAPPRMMYNEGFEDTLSLFSGIDLHGGNLSGLFNPYAAVPSMHMGYALMIGVVTALLVKSTLLRCLALTYPVLVFITIVATANHYIVDAAAGGAVMMGAFFVTWFVTRTVALRQTKSKAPSSA